MTIREALERLETEGCWRETETGATPAEMLRQWLTGAMDEDQLETMAGLGLDGVTPDITATIGRTFGTAWIAFAVQTGPMVFATFQQTSQPVKREELERFWKGIRTPLTDYGRPDHEEKK